VNPNRVSNELVNTADIFATVLDLFGDTAWAKNIPQNKPVDSMGDHLKGDVENDNHLN